MSKNSLNHKEWQLVTQALLDGEGYPKSENNKQQLRYSKQEIRSLLDKLMLNHTKELADFEKQMILNCIDGALDYVTSDIPSLYDISDIELKNFKESLEKHWNMNSTYQQYNAKI